MDSEEQNHRVDQSPPACEKVAEPFVRHIVDLATRAPSADNCQPWEFVWDGFTLLVRGDRARGNFALDVRQESLLIALGAVLENIRIAAASLGFGLHWTMLPHEDREEVLIRFYTSSGSTNPLLPHLGRRCVNRRRYKRARKVEHDCRDRIERVAQRETGVGVIWCHGRSERRTLQKAVLDAEESVFREQALHQGLIRWLRWDRVAKDGLPLDTLGLNVLERFAFPVLSRWGAVSRLNLLGLSKLLRFHAFRLMVSSPEFCLFTLQDTSREGYLRGGMVFQRVWLTAHSLGLSLQPMSAFVFLMHRYKHDGGKQLSAWTRGRAGQMCQQIDGFLNERGGGTPFMFIRLGYASPPKARSNRRPLDDVFRVQDPPHATSITADQTP